MSEHRVRVDWRRGAHSFDYESYDRGHDWRFPEGPTVRASAAPEFLGDASLVDPEQAFVAALASCHMLTFLAIAARRRLVVNSYCDQAVGVLEKNADGRLALTRVTLRPRIEFESAPPDAVALRRLHDQSHQTCFLANSVTTSIVIEPDSGHA